MPKVFLGDCRVLENRVLARDTNLLRLEAPEIAATGRPGRFVMVRTGPYPEKGGGPLLKRPFSLHRLGPGREISILFRVVGVGTRLLSRVRPGETLEILGPLGRGFDLEKIPARVYLAAGGLGLAPMLALAEALRGRTRFVTFYGVKTGVEAPPDDYLALFPGNVVLTSEDGSRGLPGLVAAPLARALAEQPAPIFACGPYPMLRATAELAARAGVAAQVSLEAHMACGLGACLGCVAPKPGGGYARVCQEGPVFRAEEVTWRPDAI
ncbi:MAG: dihydroorotate dehydrogenase electron transfer subunit [Pseudomonadota bacterium]